MLFPLAFLPFIIYFLKLLISVLIGANCIITEETLLKNNTHFISNIYLF